jgi:hypothetical protein
MRTEHMSRVHSAGRRTAWILAAGLCCAVLAGCPPRKPQPIATPEGVLRPSWSASHDPSLLRPDAMRFISDASWRQKSR